MSQLQLSFVFALFCLGLGQRFLVTDIVLDRPCNASILLERRVMYVTRAVTRSGGCLPGCYPARFGSSGWSINRTCISSSSPVAGSLSDVALTGTVFWVETTTNPGITEGLLAFPTGCIAMEGVSGYSSMQLEVTVSNSSLVYFTAAGCTGASTNNVTITKFPVIAGSGSSMPATLLFGSGSTMRLARPRNSSLCFCECCVGNDCRTSGRDLVGNYTVSSCDSCTAAACESLFPSSCASSPSSHLVGAICGSQFDYIQQRRTVTTDSAQPFYRWPAPLFGDDFCLLTSFTGGCCSASSLPCTPQLSSSNRCYLYNVIGPLNTSDCTVYPDLQSDKTCNFNNCNPWLCPSTNQGCCNGFCTINPFTSQVSGNFNLCRTCGVLQRNLNRVVTVRSSLRGNNIIYPNLFGIFNISELDIYFSVLTPSTIISWSYFASALDDGSVLGRSYTISNITNGVSFLRVGDPQSEVRVSAGAPQPPPVLTTPASGVLTIRPGAAAALMVLWPAWCLVMMSLLS